MPKLLNLLNSPTIEQMFKWNKLREDLNKILESH